MSARIQSVIRSTPSGFYSVAQYARLAVLVSIFLAGFGIRMVHSDQPPLDFHPTRQYRSLLIARAYYFDMAQSAPEWEQDLARISRARQGTLEPTVMEFVTAIGYYLAGGERLWIPRLLATLAWLIGGGALYCIARELAGSPAAIFSTAFYLFAPFSVIASRSFQPDPLMVAAMLAAVAALIRYHRVPSDKQLIIAAVLSGVAFLVKPASVFPVLGVFSGLVVHREGPWRAVRNPRNYLFYISSLLPAFLFYIYKFQTGSTLEMQAQASFLPQLLFRPFFWRGWLGNIDAVVGLGTVGVALVSLFLIRSRFARIVMISLWAGYGAFCLAFTYHIATHDYYHLQLVPIVAISIGPMAAVVIKNILKLHETWYSRAAVTVLGAAAIVLLSVKAEAMTRMPDADRKIQTAVEIGQRIGHSTNTIHLSADYGLPLEYHGKFSGRPWPLISDLEWERLAGNPPLSAQDRFETWFASESPEYFVVADLREYEAQSDLKNFLSANFLVMAHSDDYLIFELQ